MKLRLTRPKVLLKSAPAPVAVWTDGVTRRFEFQKSRQLFIRTHTETLSVAAMRVCDPDCSLLRMAIHR
jgi:hypothetical protein